MDAEILISLRAHRPADQYIEPIRGQTCPMSSPAPVLFPERRHRQPGAEFRPLGTDRHADTGRRTSRAATRWPRGCCMHAANPRRGRRAPDPGARTIPPCRWTSTGCAPRSSDVSQRDVANNLLASLSSSSLVAPSYFLNPAEQRELFRRGADAAVAVDSVSDLIDTPVSRPDPTASSGPTATRRPRR